MTEHAHELTSSGGELRHLADEAASGEVIYVTSGGERIAAIVPAAVGPIAEATIEAMEDAADARAATEALAEWAADGYQTTSLADINAKLGDD